MSKRICNVCARSIAASASAHNTVLSCYTFSELMFLLKKKCHKYRQLYTFSDLLAADTFTCINLSRVCTFKAAVFGSCTCPYDNEMLSVSGGHSSAQEATWLTGSCQCNNSQPKSNLISKCSGQNLTWTLVNRSKL